MHCPKCGQQQVSDEIRFCSRCGLPLSDIATVVSNDGIIPGRVHGKSSSARTRGLKQGFFLLLLSLLVVPIAAIITIANDARPEVAAAVFFLTVVGGLLRMAYAATFESGEPGSGTIEDNMIMGIGKILKKRREKPELTAAPASSEFYAAPSRQTWLDTNELATPPSSVTDNTTKLLEKEEPR